MAAEDYIDDPYPDPFDHEDGLDYYPAKRSVTCKRCGKTGLFWNNKWGGWRLQTRSGILHTCTLVLPRPGWTVDRLNNLNHDLTQGITQAFSTPSSESPIMDKNAVAFIRNDVRTLTVAFINSEPGENPGHFLTSDEARVKAMPLKKYTYLTTDASIQRGDWALVPASGLPKTVFVVDVSDELSIEPNAPITYAWAIGRVDLAPYTRLLDQNAKIHDMLRSSYQSTLREGFRQTLLAGLPSDKQESLSLILSSKE